MKTFNLKIWMTMILIASSLPLFAYDYYIDGIYYNLNNDGKSVSVTNNGGDSSYKGNVTIPSTIVIGNKNIPVTGIGDEAFYYSHATSISISEGVTSIGRYAFFGCYLTSIEIPNSVTSIGRYAFFNCYISDVKFASVESMCRISYGDGSANPCRYGKKLYINGEIVSSISIPEGVTSIGNYAFYYCSSLTSISIPEGVTSIGNYAFYYCSSLTSIEIPESVTSIGNYAFRNCSTLTSIEIPNSVTSIGNYAFYYCSSLTSVKIGNGVTSIGDYAFYGCFSLTSIEIPNSMTSIGDYAFYGCSSLTSIEIPNSMTSIEYYAFSGCSSLTSIKIPNSVTSIGSYAFSGCSSLTSIEIPNSVTSIGNEAFKDCLYLTSVICYAENVPKLKSDVFKGALIGLATLYVPASAIDDYKKADQWKDFGTILPLEDIPAGINIIDTQKQENDDIYTIDGKRIKNPQKGIYIRNGKKVLMR